MYEKRRLAPFFHNHNPIARINHAPISISPMLNPPNLSQRISMWSPGRAALQTLTGDPYLPKTGILPPLAIVTAALHAAPAKTRKACGLFFVGLFNSSTTIQKLMQHHRFGYICQMILASMISIISSGFRPRAYVNICSAFSSEPWLVRALQLYSAVWSPTRLSTQPA